MKAIWYTSPRTYDLLDRPDPEPAPGEVRLRVRSAGVCGTDLHLHEGEFSPRYPFTPGHEIVGEVDELGEGVDDLRAGQLVAVNNRISCGTCTSCRRAMPAFCTRLRDLGVTEPGGLAELVAVPSGQCHPVDDMPLETAALAEPLACVIHGMDVLALRPGSDVLLVGAGTTGLLLTQLLLSSGALRLTVAAPTASKLELARGLGAHETELIDRDDPGATAAALRTRAPDGYDVVVDATGAPAVQAQCVQLTRDGGTVLFYGMAPEAARVPLSTNEVFTRELTIKGSFTQAFSFDRAVAALRSGAVRTEGMVTHHFDLPSYREALDAVALDRSSIKVVVNP